MKGREKDGKQCRRPPPDLSHMQDRSSVAI
jgi:hypothetical protein